MGNRDTLGTKRKCDALDDITKTSDLKCEICKEKWGKAQADFDAIYTRVLIDLSFDIPKTTYIERIKHNAKDLEKQQRLKNVSDIAKKE